MKSNPRKKKAGGEIREQTRYQAAERGRPAPERARNKTETLGKSPRGKFDETLWRLYI